MGGGWGERERERESLFRGTSAFFLNGFQIATAMLGLRVDGDSSTP